MKASDTLHAAGLDAGRTDRSGKWWRPRAADDADASIDIDASEAAPEKDSNLPFVMLQLFTFILLLAPQLAFPVLAPLRIALMVVILAILTYVTNRLSHQMPLLHMSAGIKPALFLAGWAVLTLPMSFWPGGSVDFLMGDYFKTLVVFVLLAHVIDSAWKLQRLSWALVLMAVPLAFTTLSHFSAGTFVQDSARVAGYNAPLTANPNDLALMLNLILPFAIALYLASRKFFAKLVLALTIFLLVGAIIVTFSRAGFLALTMIFVYYMWLVRKRSERVLIPVVLVLACIALPLVPNTYSDRLNTITNIEADQSNSAQTRWSDLQTATKLVLANPLVGVGVGMNIFAMNEARGETWTEIHNVYLAYAVELGIPGLLMFLLLFRSCLRNTREVLARIKDIPALSTLFYLAEGIRVSLLAFGLEAFFHPVAYDFYFYYIAGLAVALRIVCDREVARLDGIAHEQPQTN